MGKLDIFGPVWDGSGARGWAGEGYPFHKFVPFLSFEGSTPVSKTVTAFKTIGNMPLTKNYAPRDWFPKCIWFDLWRAIMLNAVALSGPGIEDLLVRGWWQHLRDPYMISYMPVLPVEDPRHDIETEHFVYHLKRSMHLYVVPFAIQINVTCPNVGADFSQVIAKAESLLSAFQVLNVPLVVKLNLLVPPEAAWQIAAHPACDGIIMGNTIPFGTVLPDEWWAKNFRNGSPLIARGLQQPGGLSGAPLLPLMLDWVRKFRKLDSGTYVNIGGGILEPDDVDRCHDVGANSISIASIAVLRGWRTRAVIERAHKVFA